MTFLWMKLCAWFIWCMSIAELFINQPASYSSWVGAGLTLHSFRLRAVVRSAISPVLLVWSRSHLIPAALGDSLCITASKVTYGSSGPTATSCFLMTKPLVFGSFAHLSVGMEWFIWNCAYWCATKLVKCCAVPLVPFYTRSTFLMKNWETLGLDATQWWK